MPERAKAPHLQSDKLKELQETLRKLEDEAKTKEEVAARGKRVALQKEWEAYFDSCIEVSAVQDDLSRKKMKMISLGQCLHSSATARREACARRPLRQAARTTNAFWHKRSRTLPRGPHSSQPRAGSDMVRGCTRRRDPRSRRTGSRALAGGQAHPARRAWRRRSDDARLLCSAQHCRRRLFERGEQPGPQRHRLLRRQSRCRPQGRLACRQHHQHPRPLKGRVGRFRPLRRWQQQRAPRCSRRSGDRNWCRECGRFEPALVRHFAVLVRRTPTCIRPAELAPQHEPERHPRLARVRAPLVRSRPSQLVLPR